MNLSPAHIGGLDNAAGYWYLWWSGVGGFALLAVSNAYVQLRKHNCHTKGCWRIGLRAIDGTTQVVCHKHHPLDKPEAGEIQLTAEFQSSSSSQ